MKAKYPIIFPPNAKIQKQQATKDFRLKPGTKLYNETVINLRRQLRDAHVSMKDLPILLNNGKINEEAYKKIKKSVKESISEIEKRIEYLLNKKNE